MPRRQRSKPYCQIESIEPRTMLAIATFGEERVFYANNSFSNADVGSFAAPMRADGYNGTRLFVGAGNGTVTRFSRAPGSSNVYWNGALFNDTVPTRFPSNASMGSMPEVVGWENFGTFDLLVGDMDGVIHLYLSRLNPVMTSSGSGPLIDTPVQLPEHPGTYAKPKAMDWNFDGKNDLLIGVEGDNVVYLNTSTTNVPEFSTAPLRLGFGYTGQNSPVFKDLDFDDLPDLIVAGESSIRFYKNTGTTASPQFDGTFTTIVSSTASPITRLEVADWDGDQVGDLIYGCVDGQVYWRQQDVPTVSIGTPAPVAEGDGEWSALNFPVYLSRPFEGHVVVNIIRGERSEIGDAFWPSSLGAEFEPGETMKMVTVLVEANDVVGPDRRIIAKATFAFGATPDQATVQGLIIDDEGPPPSMAVSGAGGRGIANNDSTPTSADGTEFGTMLIHKDPALHSFTITNSGQGTLWLGPIAVPDGFTLVSPASESVAPGGSTTFTVSLDKTADGTFAGEISIPNLSAQALGNTGMPLEFNFTVAGRVIGEKWSLIASADMNRDSRPDLVWRHRFTGENVIQYMNGITPIQSLNLPAVSTDWALAGVADLNADLNQDFVWRNLKTGVNLVWFMKDRKQLGHTYLPQVSKLNLSISGIADFTGDAKPDVLWYDGNQYTIWQLRGTTVRRSLLPTWTRPGNSQLVSVGDLNGDGTADLIWRNKTSGIATAWLMNQTIRTAARTLTEMGDLRLQSIFISNIVGTPDPDLVLRNVSTGQTKAWEMLNLTPDKLVWF